MTEFSILSTESQIMPSENVLDLRICEINFNRDLINQSLGMRDALPNAIKTFVTLDFFNHDTKHTDLITGYDPQFDFIFNFKNQVDDFYLKYLSEESVLIEVFTVKSSGNRVTEKIGEAKLPLIILLQNDQGFQTQAITQAQNNVDVNIGKITYKARMRKPLNEALKWLKMKQDVTEKQQTDLKRIN